MHCERKRAMPSLERLLPDSTAGQRWTRDLCPPTSSPGRLSSGLLLRANALVSEGQVQATESKAATGGFPRPSFPEQHLCAEPLTRGSPPCPTHSPAGPTTQAGLRDAMGLTQVPRPTQGRASIQPSVRCLTPDLKPASLGAAGGQLCSDPQEIQVCSPSQGHSTQYQRFSCSRPASGDPWAQPGSLACSLRPASVL